MNDNINPDPAKDQTPGAPPNEQPKPKRIRRKPQAPHPKAKAVPPACLSCEFRKKALEYAEKEKAGQASGGAAKTRLIDEIRRLQIPARAKAELAILCSRAKELGRKILRFLSRHRALGEAAVLGAIVAYALCFIPWIGGLAALIGMGLCLASGILRQLREDLAALFAAEMPAHA